MKKHIFSVIMLLAIFVVLSGCDSDSGIDPEIFQYKNSYVGDNSAVSAIVSQLPAPNGEELTDIELQTKTEPYGVTLNYKKQENLDGVEPASDYSRTVIYNSSVLLFLVPNAEVVTFNYVKEQYTITKQNVEEWLGKPLSTFVSVKQLTGYIEYYLEDANKIKQFNQ